MKRNTHANTMVTGQRNNAKILAIIFDKISKKKNL